MSHAVRKGRTYEMDVGHLCCQPIPDAGPANGGARGRPGGRPRAGGPAHRPHGAADPGTPVPAQHGVRRAECHAAVAVRGQGAREGAQRAHRADRRHGVRAVERLRRAHPHADGGAPGPERAALQRVPHHGALLADPLGLAQRPQPSHEQPRLDRRDRHHLPRPDRSAPQQRGAAGGDAAAERLQHRRLRQVARDRGLGGQPVRPDRPLADPLGLRQVLRLHRRRDQPVGAAAL